MLVKDVFRIYDTTQSNRLIIVPTTKPILGQMPSGGRFISVNVYDTEKISQIENEEVQKLYVRDNNIWLEL